MNYDVDVEKIKKALERKMSKEQLENSTFIYGCTNTFNSWFVCAFVQTNKMDLDYVTLYEGVFHTPKGVFTHTNVEYIRHLLPL